jgi:hypothetical protein
MHKIAIAVVANGFAIGANEVTVYFLVLVNSLLV